MLLLPKQAAVFEEHQPRMNLNRPSQLHESVDVRRDKQTIFIEGAGEHDGVARL